MFEGGKEKRDYPFEDWEKNIAKEENVAKVGYFGVGVKFLKELPPNWADMKPSFCLEFMDYWTTGGRMPTDLTTIPANRKLSYKNVLSADCFHPGY